jgi:hypothetical protein
LSLEPKAGQPLFARAGFLFSETLAQRGTAPGTRPRATKDSSFSTSWQESCKDLVDALS